jgi:hypothetical protein
MIDPREIIVTANEIAKPFAGTLGDAWAVLIGDRMAVWRLRNAIKLQEKVLVELKARGLALNPARIPDRYAFSWFEEATKQDEPEIQDLFARLLAGVAAGDPDAADRRHLEIVSRLVPQDASVLRYFFIDAPATRTPVKESEVLSDIEIDEWELFKGVRDTFGTGAWKAVEHLMALGALERRFKIDNDSVDAALSTLQTDREGNVFPSWGLTRNLEIQPLLAATETSLSLARALSL